MNASATWTANSALAQLGERLGESAGYDRQAALKRLEMLGWLLDDAVELPLVKYRIGWDGVIGLVPGIGDAMTTALAAYFIWEAHRLGVPRWTLVKMLGNVGVDFLVGLIPGLGDLADLGFKANRRNLALLRRALAAEKDAAMFV